MQIIYGLSAQYLSSCRLQALRASRPPPPALAGAGRSCTQAAAARGLWTPELGSEGDATHQAAFQAENLTTFVIHFTFVSLLRVKLGGLRIWGWGGEGVKNNSEKSEPDKFGPRGYADGGILAAQVNLL